MYSLKILFTTNISFYSRVNFGTSFNENIKFDLYIKNNACIYWLLDNKTAEKVYPCIYPFRNLEKVKENVLIGFGQNIFSFLFPVKTQNEVNIDLLYKAIITLLIAFLFLKPIWMSFWAVLIRFTSPLISLVYSNWRCKYNHHGESN